MTLLLQDLLRTLEDRKNKEYAQAMTAVRQGVKRLEDALDSERTKYRKLDAEALALKSRVQSMETSSAAVVARLEQSEKTVVAEQQRISILEQLVEEEKTVSRKLATELGSIVATQSKDGMPLVIQSLILCPSRLFQIVMANKMCARSMPGTLHCSPGNPCGCIP